MSPMNIPKKFIQATLVSFAMIGLAGCAMTRNVTLTYPPSAPVRDIQKPTAKKVQIESNKPHIVLKVLRDNRATKDRVGAMDNALGSELPNTRVLANNDVIGWAGKAIEFELEQKGFPVTLDTNLPLSSSDPILCGNVVKVYAISYLTYEGDVQFTIELKMGDSPLLNKMYLGHGSCGKNDLITGEGFGCALSLAMQDAASQLAKDVEETLATGKAPPPEPLKVTNPKPDAVAQAAVKPAHTINFDSICGLNRELVVISGKRTPESLVKYLSIPGSEIQGFHAKRLEKNPNEYGDVFVYLEILQDASVSADSVVKSYVNDSVLEKQIVESVRKASFRSFGKEPDTTKAVYKIHFEKKIPTKINAMVPVVIIVPLLVMMAFLVSDMIRETQ
jgi:hypothetical protein